MTDVYVTLTPMFERLFTATFSNNLLKKGMFDTGLKFFSTSAFMPSFLSRDDLTRAVLISFYIFWKLCIRKTSIDYVNQVW